MLPIVPQITESVAAEHNLRMMGDIRSAKDEQLRNVDPFVGKSRHAVELGVRRVIGIRHDNDLGLTPMNHVRTFSSADKTLAIGTPPVVAGLHRHKVGLANRVPLVEHAAPAAQLLPCIDDGIALVRGPVEGVGRVEEVILHPPSRRTSCHTHGFVEFFRVLLVEILKRRFRGQVFPLGKNVVVRRPLELHQAERRPVPIDAVSRRRQTRRLARCIPQITVKTAQDRLAILDQDVPGFRRVPHLEQLIVRVEDYLQRPQAVSLPRAFRSQDGVVIRLDRRVQALFEASQALDQVIVEEELLTGSYIYRRHWRWSPVRCLLVIPSRSRSRHDRQCDDS